MTAHYLMVGGFLGAGKTTALLRAGAYLTDAGHRVGLIMNDQSESLVDTALARARDFAVEEIAGGCFCCRFNSLVEAAGRLDRAAAPDVFLAEPVGSCTDLSATVALPLRHIYGDRYRVAPLSVLVDPDRALRVLGLESGRSFSPKVLYVYEKQLEEADVLVINKIDTVAAPRVAALRGALAARYPRARLVEISARSGAGVGEWIDSLLREEPGGRVLDIDYDTYADGEALLGWLNCTARLSGTGTDGDRLLLALAGDIHAMLRGEGVEIAHLKLTLVPAGGHGIAVVNATRTDVAPELAFAIDAQVDEAELTINLRAEAEPERLERAVRAAAAAANRPGAASVIIEHLERFRPGRPVPTHRMTAATT
ncbi:MAG TPA: GTP-binding protein [Vicinamibacterales bacterium]|nr:GTP-binding protein [Vicinamibacterales bacterium]